MNGSIWTMEQFRTCHVQGEGNLSFGREIEGISDRELRNRSEQSLWLRGHGCLCRASDFGKLHALSGVTPGLEMSV